MSRLSWGTIDTQKSSYYKGISLYVDRDKKAPLPKNNKTYGEISISSLELKSIDEFLGALNLEPGDTAKLVVEHIEEEVRTKKRPIKLIIQPPNKYIEEED